MRKIVSVVVAIMASMLMVACGSKTETVTFSEMVNERIEKDGSVVFYETQIPLWEMWVLVNGDIPTLYQEISSYLGKDTVANAYKYDGYGVTLIGENLPFDVIDTGNFEEKDDVKWLASWGAITDNSENYVTEEFIYDRNYYNHKVEEMSSPKEEDKEEENNYNWSIFDDDDEEDYFCGTTLRFGYYTRFNFREKNYIVFFTDPSHSSRTTDTSVIFIEDKKDTKNKEFAFDSIGVDGIDYDCFDGIDGLGSRYKTINDIADEPLFGN